MNVQKGPFIICIKRRINIARQRRVVTLQFIPCHHIYNNKMINQLFKCYVRKRSYKRTYCSVSHDKPESRIRGFEMEDRFSTRLEAGQKGVIRKNRPIQLEDYILDRNGQMSLRVSCNRCLAHGVVSSSNEPYHLFVAQMRAFGPHRGCRHDSSQPTSGRMRIMANECLKNNRYSLKHGQVDRLVPFPIPIDPGIRVTVCVP